MKRIFIFQDAKSQKFWSIDVEGTGFTVQYGRLGTDGQTSTKSFDTEDKCQKEADKLIAEKTKKGYVESTEETVKSTTRSMIVVLQSKILQRKFLKILSVPS